MSGIARRTSSKARRVSAFALALFLSTPPIPAAELPLLLGTIGADNASAAVQAELRLLFHRELSSTELTRIRTEQRYVLAATLVRLDSVRSPHAVRATCVVSVALLRGRGTLFAVLRGRATAEDESSPADIVESDALRAAVHSVMARIPSALRAAEREK